MLLRCDDLTLAAIADELNTPGYRTRRGQVFYKGIDYLNYSVYLSTRIALANGRVA